MNEVHCKLVAQNDLEQMKPVTTKLGIDLERLADFLKHSQNLAFIAELHGEVVGLIYGYVLVSLNSAPQLFVYAVDVLPKFQNQGIGSKLFQYVVDYSRRNGFSECFVITDKANKKACRIYEKAGGKNDFEDEIVYVIKHG